MPTTLDGHRPIEIAQPVPLGADAVEYARAPVAGQVFGLSPSRIRRLARAGHIRLVKLGRATMVDCASVRAFMAGLPTVSK